MGMKSRSAHLLLFIAIGSLCRAADAQGLGGLAKKFGLPSVPPLPNLKTTTALPSTPQPPTPSSAITFPDASPSPSSPEESDNSTSQSPSNEAANADSTPFETRAGPASPSMSAAFLQKLDEQFQKKQIFVEKGDDGKPKTNKLVEIITVPNLVEMGPPRVLECKVYGEQSSVIKKLGSEEIKSSPPKHVTTNVMSSLLEKCQQHMLQSMAKRQKERAQANATDDGLPDESSGGGTIWNSLVIYPGTKWCGAGNVAREFEDLGLDKKADACCREHDHCSDAIPAGEEKYNLSNTDSYTKSNCACDSKFAKCLKEANTYIGHQIGRSYFNVIQIQCFREDYPIVNCTEKKGFGFNTIRTSCQNYELDESQPKRVQFFDPPFYDGDSGPLLYIPVVSDTLNEPIKEVRDKFINGGVVGTVIG